MNRRLTYYATLLSLLFVMTASAEEGVPADAAVDEVPASKKIYKKVGKDGRITYSSAGTEEEQVDVRDANSISLPRLVIPPQADKAITEYESVVITDPENGAVIDITGEELPVSVNIKAAVLPALNVQAGDRLQLYVNGEKSGEPMSSGQFLLTEVYRGAYAVQAVVIDKEGEELIRSELVEFSMRQHAIDPKPATKTNGKK